MSSLYDDLKELRKKLLALRTRADIRLGKGLDTLMLTGPDGFLEFGDKCDFFLAMLEGSGVVPQTDTIAGTAPDPPQQKQEAAGYLLLLGCVDLKGFDTRVMLEDLLNEFCDLEGTLPTSGVLIVRDPITHAGLLPYLIENAAGVIE